MLRETEENCNVRDIIYNICGEINGPEATQSA